MILLDDLDANLYSASTFAPCDASSGNKASGPTHGLNGAIGTIGSYGSNGPSGSVGTFGPMKSIGSFGAIKSIGTLGSTGTFGPSGSLGPIGALGPIGTLGPTEARGADWIASLTALDCFAAYAEKVGLEGGADAVERAAARVSAVRSAARAAQQVSGAAHRLRADRTASRSPHSQSEIAAVTPNRLFIPRPPIPAVMTQVAATAALRNIPITAEGVRRTVVENRFDFRQSMNSLEFYRNSRGNTGSLWPFRRVGADWAFHPSWLALDDEFSLFFALSNFLPFFCDAPWNETPSETPASRAVSIDSVRPSILSKEGGEVEIRGEMEKVAEVWLNGNSSQKLEIRKREASSLVVAIPAGLSGLYFLEFHLRNGLIGAFRDDFPWFGNVGIGIRSQEVETWNSENEFENPMEFERSETEETEEMEKRGNCKGKNRKKGGKSDGKWAEKEANELSELKEFKESKESIESNNESNESNNKIESNNKSNEISEPNNPSMISNESSHLHSITSTFDSPTPSIPSSSSSFPSSSSSISSSISSSSISLLTDLCEFYEVAETASLLTSTSARNFKVSTPFRVTFRLLPKTVSTGKTTSTLFFTFPTGKWPQRFSPPLTDAFSALLSNPPSGRRAFSR